MAEEAKPSWVAKVAYSVYMVYLLGAMLAFPCLSWRYATEHGFVQWMLLGHVIPGFQAAIWPYYLFSALQ